MSKGLFFEVVNGVRRSVYRQDDNNLILADECKCAIDYQKIDPNKPICFKVIPNDQCPIEGHRRIG